MRFELRPLESIYWTAKPVYKIRYPLLTFVFFGGLFAFFRLGPVGQAIGTFSFLLSLVFLAVTIISTILWSRKRYYLTNFRVVSHKHEMELRNLSSVTVYQSWLNKIRKIGTLTFDSATGEWVEFERVKEPERLRNRIVKVPDATRVNSDTMAPAQITSTPEPAPQSITPLATTSPLLAEMEPVQPPTIRQWLRHHRKWIGVSIFLIVLLGSVIAFVTYCPGMNVINSGTMVSLQPNHHAEYSFTSNGRHTVFGAFSANAVVIFYAMTSAQFDSFNSTGNASNYIFSIGPVSSFDFNSLSYSCGRNCTVYESLPFSGLSYYVFYNPSGAVGTVSVDKTFFVESC